MSIECYWEWVLCHLHQQHYHHRIMTMVRFTNITTTTTVTAISMTYNVHHHCRHHPRPLICRNTPWEALMVLQIVVAVVEEATIIAIIPPVSHLSTLHPAVTVLPRAVISSLKVSLARIYIRTSFFYLSPSSIFLSYFASPLSLSLSLSLFFYQVYLVSTYYLFSPSSANTIATHFHVSNINYWMLLRAIRTWMPSYNWKQYAPR